MSKKLNKPEDCKQSAKVLTEEDKKVIKEIADAKKKKVQNSEKIKK